jgi:hypothetical protein
MINWNVDLRKKREKPQARSNELEKEEKMIG